MSTPRSRIAEFLRQWAMMRDKTDLIYGVLADPTQDETTDLTVSDLRAILAEPQPPLERAGVNVFHSDGTSEVFTIRSVQGFAEILDHSPGWAFVQVFRLPPVLGEHPATPGPPSGPDSPPSAAH